jgi:hypothetical protein
VLRIRDLGSGAFFNPGFGIRDPGSGMGKKSRSRSGIRIRDEHIDHISESLETMRMRIRIQDPRISLTLDTGSGIRDGKNSDLGSGINIPDSQYVVHAPQVCGF